MTFIFSIVGSINTYNNAINSIYDLEYMQQYGETYKSILNAFDQNLTSAMRFYAVGAFFYNDRNLCFTLLSMSIQHSNQKYYFYCDYMKIIEELLKSKFTLHCYW